MIEDLAIVQAWHEAVNSGDVERLIMLSSDDIEVGGPRGTGKGAQLLRDWFGRAGIRLEPRRIFGRRRTVVVEQDAQWVAPGIHESSGHEVVASVFTVRGGRVTSVIRYPELVFALQAAGLSEADSTIPGEPPLYKDQESQ